MTTTEAESFAELIADCADIPRPLRDGGPVLPGQREPAPWEVNETTFAQVNGLEEYV
ncbi:hypothetical protein [Actinophytocola glycyrrhizae]|uniref:Uncharacterized protein n=1 Tax=Actinophytocola glycyrrhizae TaxID=2044873 RepID=A0ABV9SD62_9PSEU